MARVWQAPGVHLPCRKAVCFRFLPECELTGGPGALSICSGTTTIISNLFYEIRFREVETVIENVILLI